ncbi:hypothetical protein GmHk_13G037356 [Glycine max]|nr:hypothetical protein GmHk_13G037356 [Glycine max]
MADELCRRGFSSPLLKFLDQDQTNYVLRKLHEGVCGMHLGGRTMATRVLRVGYYAKRREGLAAGVSLSEACGLRE